MIYITLPSYPEKGQETRLCVDECQAGTDPREARWEVEVKDNVGFGFAITSERREVKTEEAVMIMMTYENANTTFLLRALGWSEQDIDNLWDSYREAGV